MIKYLKRDSYLFGGIFGAVLPGIALVIIAAIFRFLESVMAAPVDIEKKHLLLLSIIINLFPLRTYLVKFNYDKTGRGILLITFIYVIAFFVFIH